MAFGFPPRYSATLPLINLSESHFLMLTWETFGRLGWERKNLSRHGCSALVIREAVPAEEVMVTLDNGIAYVTSKTCNQHIHDDGRNKKNLGELEACLETVKNGLPAEVLDERFAALEVKWVAEGDPVDIRHNYSESTGFWSVFIPKKGYYATPILVGLNVLVFLVMICNGVGFMYATGEDLLSWGGNLRSATVNGEAWRLVTCTFVHLGFLHLAANMYAFFFIGAILEPRIGTGRFVLAYFITGIAASLTSIGWHEASVSVGASGAIFGVFGVFLALLTTTAIDASVRRAFFTGIAIFVVYSLIQGLRGGVDNAAHVGGLVSGMIVGYGLFPALKYPDRAGRGMAAFTSVCALLITASLFFFQHLRTLPRVQIEYSADRPWSPFLHRGNEAAKPNTIPVSDDGQYNWKDYYEKMRRFKTMETEALKIYSADPMMSDENKLYEIKDRGMYYWNENLTVLNEAEELKLPPAVHETNKLLIAYCNLREHGYELMYKKIEEHTSKYDADLGLYETQIASILKKLQAQASPAPNR